MKDFKKRTLVLMLASVITVTGSFAADNYKNSLMDMVFKPQGVNEMSVVLCTKTPYENTVALKKTDASTYVIMLPEFDSELATPDISEVSGIVQSVDIKKMPYSNGSKGYTKVVIKTSNDMNLNVGTTLYVPAEKKPSLEDNTRKTSEQTERRRRTSVERNDTYERETKANSYSNFETKDESQNRQYSQTQFQSETQTRPSSRIYEETPTASTVKPQSPPVSRADNNPPKTQNQPVSGVSANPQKNQNSQPAANTVSQKPKSEAKKTDVPEVESKEKTGAIVEDKSQQAYFIGLVALIIMFIIYFYNKAKNKLTNVLGERLEIDINDDEKKEKSKSKSKSESRAKNKRKIGRTINKLDSEYSKPSVPEIKSFYENSQQENNIEKPEEETNIVDLDALFKEKTAKPTEDTESETTETDALDDFLSGFTFEDTEKQSEKVDSEVSYDEKAYDELLKKNEISFNEDDIECVNELLQSEISDDVIKNIEDYAVSNPVEQAKPSKSKILEGLVTGYAVSQNIVFSEDDINILKKLISVEIDEDFVNDLRTNPQRTKEMEDEIIRHSQKPKPSEIVTLKVKDMLPDLSAALKKQGRRPIVSEAQPETVYFSEGYEVSKLSIDFDQPDFSKEAKKKNAYAVQPSEEVQVVDQSYNDSVEKLSISGLPDLKDVMAHPNKYKTPPKKEAVADEKTLLNNIMNVTFKPFDDGTRNFEIINTFEEEYDDENAPDISDIEKEFSQFDNFEVAKEEESDKIYTQNDYDDFESLYNNNFVDLDSELKQEAGDVGDNKENTSEVVSQNSVMSSERSERPEEEVERPESKHKRTIYKIERFIPKNLSRISQKFKPHVDNSKSDKLMDIIQSGREKRKADKLKKQPETVQIQQNSNIQASNDMQPELKCIVDGVSYDIVSTAKITPNIGCHLAKSKTGYVVLAYKDSELSIIKEYDSVRVDKIQARLSETLDDGTPRYLIKVGSSKLIADIRDGQINYVMDL